MTYGALRPLAVLAAIGIASAVLAQAKVDYSCLAKPLPDVLADLGSLLGKKVVCAPALAEDRLCIYVTDVSPQDLLERVVKCVSGKAVSSEALTTIVPDEEGERALRQRILDQLPERLLLFKEELSNPVELFKKQVDLSALARFVTVELVESLPMGEDIVFSRVPWRQSRPLPSIVPDYHLEAPRDSFAVGTEVILRLDRYGLLLRLAIHTSISYMIPFRRQLVGSFGPPLTVEPYNFAASAALTARKPFFYGRFGSWGYREVLLLEKLEAMAGAPWGAEPLNAIAAPTIHEMALTWDKDIVAYLDDRAANSSSHVFAGASLHEDGDWLVASVAEPPVSRRWRFDRAQLDKFASEARARGYIDFWKLIEYQNLDGAASDPIINALAAGMGPVGYALFKGTSYWGDRRWLATLKSDPVVWQRIERDGQLDLSTIPTPTLNKLVLSFPALGLLANVRVESVIPGTDLTQSTERLVPVQSVLTWKALRDGAILRYSKSSSVALLAVNAERKYAMLTTPQDYQQALVAATSGERGSAIDALASTTSFLPIKIHHLAGTITFEEVTIRGLQATYCEPVGGVKLRRYEELPREWKGPPD